jgi:hypothetical protein
MRKLLLATASALLAMSVTGNAATITDLGLDPTSATGNFSNSLGNSTSAFDDQYTFSLDHSMTLTIASVTNVFPQSTDFITNFMASVISGTPAVPGSTVLGPDAATQGCGAITLCQSIAGSAILPAGNYFLDISGTAGGTSGYGGNLSSVAVPGPIVGAGLPGLVAALGWFGYGRFRRKKLAG